MSGASGDPAGRRVGLFVIGAQKCGTSSLAAALAAHPEIDFCARKEPHFFSRSGDAWRERLDAYHALFGPASGRLRAEASTSYTFLPEHPGTAERIHQYNPDARLVYLMRDPLERIVSHWLHRRVRHRVRGSIGDAVEADPTYLDRSRYATQLDPYLRRFGRERVRPVVFEEYVADPAAGLAAVLEWMGLEPIGVERAGEVVNPSVGRSYFRARPLRALARNRLLRAAARRAPQSVRRGLERRLQRRVTERPRLPQDVTARLANELGEEVRRVEALLGRPVAVWRLPR